MFEIPLKVVAKKSKRPVSNTSNALSKNSKILLSKTFLRFGANLLKLEAYKINFFGCSTSKLSLNLINFLAFSTVSFVFYLLVVVFFFVYYQRYTFLIYSLLHELLCFPLLVLKSINNNNLNITSFSC